MCAAWRYSAQGGVLWLVGFAVLSFCTFPLLLSERQADMDLQVVPVLSIVGFGLGITLLAFTSLRLKTARTLAALNPPESILQKILQQRRDLARLRQFDASMFSTCRNEPQANEMELVQPQDNPPSPKNASPKVVSVHPVTANQDDVRLE